MKLSFILCFHAAAFAVIGSSSAAVKVELFDINRNGVIDPSEQEAAMRHDASVLYQMADTNYDGILSPKEKENFYSAEIAKANNRVASSTRENVKPASMSYKEFAEANMVRPSLSGEYWPLFGVQFRRSLADIDRQRDKSRNDPDSYLEGLKKAKAVEFGFSNNAVAGDSSWTARGVIAKPFAFDLSNGDGGLILPSIQFDRVTHSKSGLGEIDNLILGLEGSLITSGFGPFATSRATLGAEYGTNFDWDDGKIGGKLEWEPTFSSPWLGNMAAQDVGKLPILYATRQFLHFEGGHAEATATSPSDDYARLGAGVGVGFYFRKGTPLERLSIVADYRYYLDLATSDDDFENFKATMEFRLDEEGHYNIVAAYENGLIPLSHQEVELFSFGLGIKF